MRALADESTARLAAPFVAVAPTAIWVAVSADGYFAGVAAWGIALLALAARGTARLPLLAGAGAGLLLGWGIFLNYGLGLIALPAVAVLIAAKDLRVGAARAGARSARRACWSSVAFRASPASGGSTATPWSSNAIGRASR